MVHKSYELAKSQRESPFFREVFVKSWWLMLFTVLCIVVYDQASEQRDEEFREIGQRYLSLQQEKRDEELRQEDLLLRIHSQSDHSWIELTLMKGLGLVPKHQTKVFFKKKDIND